MATRNYAAELVGTFVFMTIGYFSVPAFGAAGVPGLLVVPFSFGLGLLAAIFAFGHISGGHFNPAVSIAMALDKRMTPVDAAGYIVAQIIGAIAAALVVLVAINQAAVASGVTKPGEGVSQVGALIIDKPEGLTSHDVVARVRRASGTRRVGHAGTLDPFATGVLVCCIGRATRLVRFLVGLDKQYIATVRLGYATDTQDCTGQQITPLRTSDELSLEELRGVLDQFAGPQVQTPPMFFHSTSLDSVTVASSAGSMYRSLTVAEKPAPPVGVSVTWRGTALTSAGNVPGSAFTRLTSSCVGGIPELMVIAVFRLPNDLATPPKSVRLTVPSTSAAPVDVPP